MFKDLLLSFAASICLQNVTAQSNGIMPLTGLKFFKEGIDVKNIAVRLDGAQFLNNKIPLGKEIEVQIQQPIGFTEVNKNVYVGAELIVLSAKGDQLVNDPNIFLANEKVGYIAKNFKELSAKFGLTADILRNNSTCTIKLRFYDLKGKNQLRLEFPAVLARPGELVQVSKLVSPIKSADPVTIGMINSLKSQNMLVSVDTSIRKEPTIAYTSVDIKGIVGTSITGVFGGKESFWVYDANLNEVKVPQKLLNSVNGSMESSTVNYTLKIPYRLKTATAAKYTVRFRWESADKMQVIDVVTKK